MVGGKGSNGKRGPKDQGGKRKHPPTPPLEDFSDSKFSEERFSSEGEESLPPVPLSSSSKGLDNSMGLSTAERAYIRSMECVGLEESDDSEEDSEEEDSEEEDSKEEGGGGEDGSGYDIGDEGGNNGNGGDRGSGGKGGGRKGDGDKGGGGDSSYDDDDEGGNGNSGGRAPPA
jgi:hypothetical protein